MRLVLFRRAVRSPPVGHRLGTEVHHCLFQDRCGKHQPSPVVRGRNIRTPIYRTCLGILPGRSRGRLPLCRMPPTPSQEGRRLPRKPMVLRRRNLKSVFHLTEKYSLPGSVTINLYTGFRLFSGSVRSRSAYPSTRVFYPIRYHYFYISVNRENNLQLISVVKAT